MTEKCKKCIHKNTDIGKKPCCNCKHLLRSDTLGYTTLPDHFTSENNEADMVNHPPHYCRDGAMESIDEIKLILTPQEYRGFLLGNILKYRYRAADKNGLEDLKKSDWYAQRLKELDEGIFR